LTVNVGQKLSKMYVYFSIDTMGVPHWNTADVVRQLTSLGFGQYSRDFQANEICGIHLLLLTEDHLMEMRIASIDHRIILRWRFTDIVAGRTVYEAAPNRQSLPKINEKATQKPNAVATPKEDTDKDNKFSARIAEGNSARTLRSGT
jgi:hypothetical protein